MTAIYFFFGHLFVFWVFFTSVRVLIAFLVINVEKPRQWKLQTRLFFAFTEKNVSLFGGELLLKQVSIESINTFVKNCV